MFIKLHLTEDQGGGLILVNPDHICFIDKTTTGKDSAIHMEKHTLVVSENLNDIFLKMAETRKE